MNEIWCLLFHKLGKWGEPYRVAVTYIGVDGEFIIWRQKRTCKTCGKVQFKEIWQ